MSKYSGALRRNRQTKLAGFFTTTNPRLTITPFCAVQTRLPLSDVSFLTSPSITTTSRRIATITPTTTTTTTATPFSITSNASLWSNSKLTTTAMNAANATNLIRLPTRGFSILDTFLKKGDADGKHIAIETKKKTKLKGTVDVLQFDMQGAKLERVIPKVDLSTELGIPGRDLRTVDNNQPLTTIVIKDNAIILNLESVKAVIQADRFIVFDSKNPVIQNLLSSVEINLKKFGSSDVIYDPTHVDPFEFRVLEEILEFVYTGLNEDYKSLLPKLETIMHQPFTKKLSESLDLLYLYSEDLDQLHSRVIQVANALTRVLDSDENLAGMYLTVKMQTGYPRRKDQHQEVELILETFLNRIQIIGVSLVQLKKRVEKTEQHIRVAFASQRNHIMKLNLIFTMATVSLSVSSFGASLFGMNLRSGFEVDPMMFYAVTGSLLFTIPAIFGGILFMLKRNHTI